MREPGNGTVPARRERAEPSGGAKRTPRRERLPGDCKRPPVWADERLRRGPCSTCRNTVKFEQPSAALLIPAAHGLKEYGPSPLTPTDVGGRNRSARRKSPGGGWRGVRAPQGRVGTRGAERWPFPKMLWKPGSDGAPPQRSWKSPAVVLRRQPCAGLDTQEERGGRGVKPSGLTTQAARPQRLRAERSTRPAPLTGPG